MWSLHNSASKTTMSISFSGMGRPKKTVFNISGRRETAFQINRFDTSQMMGFLFASKDSTLASWYLGCWLPL